MHLVDQPNPSTDNNCTFTTQELARLSAYRAAVLAGFYTDWDGSATSTDTRLLARLRRVAASPFTWDERQGLVRMRKRLAAGGYADDRPTAAEAGPATPAAGRPLAE
ncbi:MAG: hypothetical protein JO020_12585 [Chloroflexi bacterium]|nr:hypothetical protein [Chloroflexota bacterium]MBV9134782.1 hypothetical protein [Chloroflexota bacterium]MBV9894999.1 hypothetical protein [Chloroflexota bacterium]